MNPADLTPACRAVSHSQGHGRFEKRTYYICEDIGWLAGREKWSGLTGTGVVFCKVEQAGKIAKQAHDFIYSRKGMTASQILGAKHSHWGIENQLHRVLDIQFSVHKLFTHSITLEGVFKLKQSKREWQQAG